MLAEILKPDFVFSNENGSLTQLVHEGWRQVNVLESKKGSSRGGHYHKENEEAFYVIKGRLQLNLDDRTLTETRTFQTGDMFLIRPYIMHTFEFLEDTCMVSVYDQGVEHADGTKDIYSEWEKESHGLSGL